MQQQAQEIRTKCLEVFAKARMLYPHLDFTNVGIRFDLHGSSAGQTIRRRGVYSIRFNADMLTRDAFDHVINNTVPHEIAHLVCFMDPTLGRNHDRGWARVCRLLGGNGERCHQEEVVYGKGYTYEYTTDRGHKVRIGDRYHKIVQSGRSLNFRAGKGIVNQHCSYSIVGHQGRTLTNPIYKAGKTTPVVGAPAASIRPTFTATPPAAPVAPVQQPQPGESKAAISRRIMLAGYSSKQTYETIIQAMMSANGYDRQLARATFKANQAKVGIPDTWGI
jgi:predicted SprT family Zn-dependent metalloprotease